MEFTTIANAKKQTKLSYLGRINASSKLMKNEKVSGNYTYAIYLAPANESGYNVCCHSTPECRLGCLATSGRAGMELKGGITMTKNCRITKSKLFFEHREFFMNWMFAEIRLAQAKAIKDGFDFSIRLNATSDIDWEKIRINNRNVFELFPDVNFYDYSKNPQKLLKNIPNYHLTFSYSGRNEQTSFDLLAKGKNIAVVFDIKRGKELPKTFNGYVVIDGDLTDFRPNDKNGVVVGLRFKRIADTNVEKEILNSVFVVKPDHSYCQ